MSASHIPAAADRLVVRLILASHRAQCSAQRARLDRMISAALQLAQTGA